MSVGDLKERCLILDQDVLMCVSKSKLHVLSLTLWNNFRAKTARFALKMLRTRFALQRLRVGKIDFHSSKWLHLGEYSGEESRENEIF